MLALVVASIAGAGVAHGQQASLIVDADPSHPVLAGSVATSIRVPAERFEFLLTLPAQVPAAQSNALRSSIHRSLAPLTPDAFATVEPANAGKGQIRVMIPHPLSDAEYQTAIGSVIAAVADATAQAPVAVRIIAAAPGDASCIPFEIAAARAARTQVHRLALFLGTPAHDGSVLAESSGLGFIMSGPPFDATPCASDAHRASFPMRWTYRIEQPMRFAPLAVSPLAAPPLAAWNVNASDVRLRLRDASGTLVTLEGHAEGRPTFAGVEHRSIGPFGRDPRTSATPARTTVMVRPVVTGCPEDARLVAEAVADAAHRAAHLAALLSATVNPRPVAVLVAPPGPSPCEPQDERFGTAGIDHPRPVQRAVTVTFELHHPNVKGPITAGTVASASWSLRSVDGQTIYPQATASGHASRQMIVASTECRRRSADGCGRDLDALALAAIRAAANAAAAPAGSRPIAIDLHGPYALAGTRGSVAGAARARVTFAAK